VNDLAAAQVEEEEHEDLAETDVVGLHEVARPRDVIVQKRRPSLAVASQARAAHVPLDGPLADADTELEQLPSDALGPPAWIAGRHFSDERSARRLGSPQGPRASPPDGAKACPVPAQDRGRLHQQDGCAPRRSNAYDEAHGEALPGCPSDAAHDLSLRHDELLSKERVLGDKTRAGPEQIDYQPQHEPKQVPHAVCRTPASVWFAFVAITGAAICFPT
jgi:hypothetical protein